MERSFVLIASDSDVTITDINICGHVTTYVTLDGVCLRRCFVAVGGFLLM